MTISTLLRKKQDGQILTYDAATATFKAADINLGGASVILNVREVLNQLNILQETDHLTRLVENLYLALDVADLNPGGYDNLSGETFYGGAKDVDLTRSTVRIEEGKISGDDKIFVTKPIYFENPVSRAHPVVKHENISDAQIKAEIAFRDAVFVKDEVVAIGTGSSQTVSLAHAQNLTNYNFALYFDGVVQENFSFDPASGLVTFTAPNSSIVTADYFYNFGAENFMEMTKTGSYPDRRNSARTSTQFTYSGAAGKVATLKLTLKQGEGESEILLTGTGKAQGFKLAHQAISGTIRVTPASVSWQYNESQNVIVATAPSGTQFKISYSWKGKKFNVDSFAVMFDD